MTKLCDGTSVFFGEYSTLLLSDENIDRVNTAYVALMLSKGYEIPKQHPKIIMNFINDALYQHIHVEPRFYSGSSGSMIREFFGKKYMIWERSQHHNIKKNPADIVSAINKKALKTMMSESTLALSRISRFRFERTRPFKERYLTATHRPALHPLSRPKTSILLSQPRVFSVPYPWNNKK